MKMLSIRTATLRPDVTLGFDVFLHISGKHILYVKRTDNIENPRLEKLHQKNVRELFIDEKDGPAYEAFLKTSVDSALKDPKLPLEVKSDIITGQSKAAVEEMFKDPSQKENYQKAVNAAANQVSLLLKHPEALEQMLKIAAFDKTVYQHSVNVASLSIGLASFLKAPAEVCNALGIGGLMHDLGKSQSKDDKQHPREGAGLLVNKNYVSKDVLDIILFHEERIDGKGYPAGLKKLDQIFQVVGLANFYDRLVTIEGKTPKDAYGEIASLQPPPYEKALIDGLKKVLAQNNVQL